MTRSVKGPAAAIGFRVKTGRATAVLLAGPSATPSVLGCRPIQLSDPKVPDSYQPYHAALELSAGPAATVVQRARKVVQSIAVNALQRLAKELRDTGHTVVGVGLVVGSDTDPTKLGNAHVRAHALEGRLFREVLEAGAQACDLPSLILVERDAYRKAAPQLRQAADRLKRGVLALGKEIAGPWRSEEKMAALGAWLALVNFPLHRSARAVSGHSGGGRRACASP